MKHKFLLISNLHDFFLFTKKLKLNFQLTYIFNKYNTFGISNILPSDVVKLVSDNNIQPFWNHSIQKLSKNLFLPSFSNITYENNNKTLKKSWFEHNIYGGKTIKNTNLELPVIKNKIPKEINRTRKIKLYLTVKQKKYLKVIIGIYRYFYNRTIQLINNYDKKMRYSWYEIKNNVFPSMNFKYHMYLEDKENYLSLITLRPHIKAYIPKWILPNFPSHLIDKAVSEAIDRTQTEIDKTKKTKRKFIMKYKNKKKVYQTINIEKNMINLTTIGMWTNWKIDNDYLFRKIKMKGDISYYKTNLTDSSITTDKYLNRTYLNLSYKTEQYIPKHKEYDIGAIDLGVRTFATIYRSNGITEIGKNSHKIIYKMCKEVDIMQSICDSKGKYMYDKKHNKILRNTYNRRRNVKKAQRRKIEKINRKLDEMHKKIIKYITSNYKRIILPPFKIQEMVVKLSSKIARQMYSMKYYTFRKNLKDKAEETGLKIYELSEAFTSKTCGCCGKINDKLNGNKIFNCMSCGLKIDRDMNGARNIMLKNIMKIKEWEIAHPYL